MRLISPIFTTVLLGLFLVSQAKGEALRGVKAFRVADGAEIIVDVHRYYTKLPPDSIDLNRQIVAPSALLVTHNEKFWDRLELAKPAAEQYVKAFNARGLPVVALVMPEKPALDFLNGGVLDDSQLVAGITRDSTFLYEGDVHFIQFKVDDLYMTGGNFTMCFCHSLWSVMTHSNFKRIHFLLPAIYGPFPGFWEENHRRTTPSSAAGSWTKEIPPALLELSKSKKLSSKNHADALRHLSDSDLLAFIKEGLFGNSEDGLPYCDSYTYIRSKPNTYTIELIRGQKRIGLIGKGRKQVQLILHF